MVSAWATVAATAASATTSLVSIFREKECWSGSCLKQRKFSNGLTPFNRGSDRHVDGGERALSTKGHVVCGVRHFISQAIVKPI